MQARKLVTLNAGQAAEQRRALSPAQEAFTKKSDGDDERCYSYSDW